MSDSLFAVVLSFGQNIIGIAARPYETYRRIVSRGSAWELLCIGVALCLYFVSASVARTASFRPFLLTKGFVVLAAATVVSYGVTVLLFWVGGRLAGAKGKFQGFALGWGYTLIPTLLWFWSTSILYVLIPPPRTTSSGGMLFSVLYLLFSATLLFWKVILSYLALRFGLKLDLGKIIAISIVVLPILFLYSIGMYRIGIFRIPFL